MSVVRKKWVFIIISIVSIMLITLSIYAYTVIRSNDEKNVEKNVIEYLEKRNEKMYPANLMENIEIIEERNIDERTFFIVHQRFNNSILKEWMNYPVTEGLRLDNYVMIEKIDQFLTYPKYREVNNILINNQNSEQCNENGFCSFTLDNMANELKFKGININNASKIKLTFEEHEPIIIDVKGKPYILEIVKVEKDFRLTSQPIVEFIYD